MDLTNSVVFYVVGAAVLIGAAWVVWRLYAKSKLAAGHRPDDQGRPVIPTAEAGDAGPAAGEK